MNRIVITGGPGFGKSSIIRELESRNFHVFHEISREIIHSQSKTDGDVVPWKNHHAFNDAVFKGRHDQFKAGHDNRQLYFYDRGVPDSLAYLEADEKVVPENYISIASTCQYYAKVFVTPPWKDIYIKDKERWEDFNYATKVHECIIKYYQELSYQIIEIPKLDVDKRVDFIINTIEPDHGLLIPAQ